VIKKENAALRQSINRFKGVAQGMHDQLLPPVGDASNGLCHIFYSAVPLVGTNNRDISTPSNSSSFIFVFTSPRIACQAAV